jgi:DNA polymerase III subunit beta
MKIQILQENLTKALGRTTRVISSRAQLPVLQNVLLRSESGMLRVIATNMEASVSTLVRAKEEGGGGVCVSAKLLSELVSTMSQETITLEEKDGSLSVSGSKVHAVLPTMPASEFPPVEAGETKGAQKVEKALLVEALSGVLFAAATDDGRPVLTGVKMQQDGDKLVLAATDGYRLSVKKIPYQAKIALNSIIPARALGEVMRIIAEEKEVKEFSLGFVGSSQVVFTIGDTTVISRTLDGEYPPYEKIIPKVHTSSATIDVQTFAKAVKSASIFARDNANIIRLHLSKNGLTISANTPQVGQNTVDVDAQVEGDDTDIAFNSRFLSEFLANCKGDQIVFRMTGSLNPGMFVNPKDDSYLHIIMPVRVQG